MNQYIDLQRLHQSATNDYPDSELFCLVDHSGMAGLQRQLSQFSIAWVSLFEGSREEGALSVAPTLFSLREVVQRAPSLLGWIAERGTFTSTMLMFASTLTMPVLARKLVTRLDAKISEDMHVMFRYFDPRVFEAMLTIFSGERRDVFLSVADQWWYVDRRGELIETDARFNDTDTFDSPIELSSAEEFAFTAASEHDQVARLVEDTLTNKYNEIPRRLRFEFVQRHMEAAKKIGINATHELALYCGLAVLNGEQFASGGVWPALLGKVASGETSLIDALDLEASNR